MRAYELYTELTYTNSNVDEFLEDVSIFKTVLEEMLQEDFKNSELNDVVSRIALHDTTSNIINPEKIYYILHVVVQLLSNKQTLILSIAPKKGKELGNITFSKISTKAELATLVFDDLESAKNAAIEIRLKFNDEFDDVSVQIKESKLTEYTHKFNSPPLEEVAQTLKTQCSKWLSETKGGIVYRADGSLQTYDDFVLKNVAKIRQDSDIPIASQAQINNYFASKGFNVKIGSSVFSSADLEEVHVYGKPMVFLPVGNFAFAWSPKVKDVLGTLFVNGRKNPNFNALLATYTNTNLPAAIASKNEIIVSCNSFYLIDPALYNEIMRIYFKQSA